MAWHELPPATSASQLVCYSMCPRKYFMTYVAHAEPEFRSLNLVLGTAVHSSIAWYFSERLAGRTPTIEATEDILAIDLLAGTTEVNVRFRDATPESVEAEGRRIVRTYLGVHSELPVMAVEERFEVPLVDPVSGETLGRPLRGFFDLVLEDRIVELKTSARGWSEFDLQRHLQVGSYCFASHSLFQSLPRVEVQVVVKLKREMRVERYVVERSTPELGWWLSAAAEIERSIENQCFPPSPGPLCRECEFERQCGRSVERRTSVPRSLPLLRPPPEAQLAL